MPKPQPKHLVKINFAIKNTRYISLDCAPEVWEDIKGFGRSCLSDGDGHSMTVSARYDFNEVVAYIEGWNKNMDVWDNALNESTDSNKE